MERYTMRLPDDLGAVPVDGYGTPEIIDRLAAYEDTGLEPDSIEEAKEAVGRAAIELAYYHKAEQEGRLLVLPCKVGDTVYRIENAPNGKQAMPAYPKYTVYAYSVFTAFGEEDGINIFVRQLNQDGTPMSSYEVFKSSAFGKTVFLTREEAEAALGKERDV